MEKYGFVYIWYDRKHKRYYIGYHWGHDHDGYICSSSWMKQAYKLRPQDFKRRILKTNIKCKKEALAEERRWLSLIKPEEVGKRYYNLNLGSQNHWHADETLKLSTSEKISIKIKAKYQDPEYRKKYEEGQKNKKKDWCTDEIRKKKSDSMKASMAQKWPEENRPKRAKQGSDEHRAKLSAGVRKYLENRTEDEIKKKSETSRRVNLGRQHRLGQTNSEEHRRKISEGQKGRKFSDESKAKMSAAKKGKVKTEEQKRAHSEAIKAWWALRKSA